MTGTDATEPPPYLHCGLGADAEEPVGCRGRRVPRPSAEGDEVEPEPYEACLAHLSDSDRSTYLAYIRPGSDLDHSGTTFRPDLLSELLAALSDPANGRPKIGRARFRGATFTGVAGFGMTTFQGAAAFGGATFASVALFGEATFERVAEFAGATFTGDADLGGATFQGKAAFGRATFHGNAGFRGATFEREADLHWATFQNNATFRGATFQDDAGFDEATFHGAALFCGATFQGDAGFDEATFELGAVFRGATFQNNATFRGATFQDDAGFDEATFETAAYLGPLACDKTVDFTNAVFSAAVTLEVAAKAVECRRTRWASHATLRVRHAAVDLSDVVLEFPLSVAAHPPFHFRYGAFDESRALDELGLSEGRVRVVSLSGADASHIVLSDIDLSECRFAGTIHLDQLRLYGRCALSTTPSGLHRRGLRPVRWTSRQTLAEEQTWRAASGHTGWTAGSDETPLKAPLALAPLYRDLRKSFEDSKNEPGAADFYFGEMEMRRLSSGWREAERWLLQGYWLLSGYGLRASRALGWLLVAMTVTVVLMMGKGLPDESPKQEIKRVQMGGETRTVIDKPDPELTLPLGQRFTGKRFEKSLRTVLNSVVFRSSGQDLTTWGTYTEMACRFTEPVLLGLALLAIRGRVKRG